MKIKTLLILLVGMILTQIPDITGIYADWTIKKYQRQYCDDAKPNECDFFKYFPPFEREHPTLRKIFDYFLLGEGSLYMIATKRCSNRIFYNANAAGKDSGKISMREYFRDKCSQFDLDASDLIWGPAHK
jgi:hypothetical protein